MQSTIFAKSSILVVSLDSEYISDYPEAFPLLLIEASTLNLSRIFLIWLVFYLSIYHTNFSVRCNKIVFETCQNFTMKNKKGF